MSRFFNKNAPFFSNSAPGATLPGGKVYFGNPNTDPLDQDNNAKAPYTDRELSVASSSVQTLTAAGKLPIRLYLDGPYSITVTDADDVVVDTDPYYTSDTTDMVTNESDVPGNTVSEALESLAAQVAALTAAAVNLNDLWPVGSLYLTTTNENPGTRLTVGTWVAHGAGRALIGVGSYTDSNSYGLTVAAGTTYGTYEAALTSPDQLPPHRHMSVVNAISSGFGTPPTADRSVAVEWDQSGNNDQYILKGIIGSEGSNPPDVGPTSSVGGTARHPNIQPSIGVYVWRRTA